MGKYAVANLQVGAASGTQPSAEQTDPAVTTLSTDVGSMAGWLVKQQALPLVPFCCIKYRSSLHRVFLPSYY